MLAARLRSAPLLLIGVAPVAVYLATRLWFIARMPYFLDEGIYANFSYHATRSSAQLFDTLTIGKEPLQSWLGIGWQWLGANPLDAMRLVSVVAGLLTLGVVALLGRLVSGPRTACVAAALCVILPFLLVHDGIGIEEPLVILVMAAALYLEIELARRPSVGRGALLGGVLAAGVLTKQSALAAVLLLPVSLLCFDFAPDARRQRLRRWISAAALALAGALSAELLLRSSANWARGQAFNRQFPLVRSVGQVVSDPFGTAGHAWSVFQPAFSSYVSLPLIALACVGALIGWRRDRRLTALLLIWILIPLAAAILLTLHPFPRHVMFILPPALVLMSDAVVWFARESGLPRPVWIVGLLLAVVPAGLLDARVLAHPATTTYPGLDEGQYVTGASAGTPWPKLADTIRQRSGGRGAVTLAAEADPNVLGFLLSSDPAAPTNRYPVVLYSEPRARRSRFAIVDQLPFSDPAALRFIAREHFTVVGRYQRPHGGLTVTLYQRPG